MKIKSIISGFLAATLFLTGCSQESSTPVIKAVALEISKDAGEYELPFSIENGSSSKQLTATTDAEWIYNINVETGRVVFSVEQNTDKSRTASMLLSYPGAEDVTVNINQGSVFDGVFKIDVSDITPYGCHIKYTPLEYSGNYIFFVMDKKTVSKYLLDKDGLDELYQGDLSWVQSVAESNNMTLEECLKHAPQFYTMDGDETEMDYTDLDYDTDYIAYCYGLSLDGKRLTDFTMAEFSTSIVETSDITFEATVTDITKSSANITITPSNDSDYYFWTYISEMDYSQYSLEEIMSNMISNIKSNVEDWGISITSYIHTGSSSDAPTDLWSGTRYYIVAWGMDYAGTPTTKPKEVASFVTESEPVLDDCRFTLTLLQKKPEDIKIRVEPTKSSTRYYVAFVEESKCKGYNDRQMAQRIVNMEASRLEDGYYLENNNWEALTYTGTKEFWGNIDLYWNFLPEHNYQIYVFGVDNGTITTAIDRLDVTTEPAVKSDLTIQTKVVNLAWNYGTFEFTPSKNDEYYLPFLMTTADAELYKNADGTYNTNLLMADIEEYYEDEIVYQRMRGKKQWKQYWQSDTEYTVIVFGYSGSNTTDFFETKIKSPAIPFDKSDAEVSVEYCFFDGNELAAKFPDKWDAEDMKDACIMLTKYTPNSAAVHWYGGVWAPVSSYEMGIDHLMALIRNDTAPANCIDEYQQTCRPWYNYKWSFSYVAEGADGNYGKWHYMEFTPTKADTIEPYDFWSEPYDGGNGTTTSVYCLPAKVGAAPVDITGNVFKIPAKERKSLSEIRKLRRNL
jgi:hypothetical protein